jgi:hypothetical protein
VYAGGHNGAHAPLPQPSYRLPSSHGDSYAGRGSLDGGSEDDAGVWNQAKRWVSAAGESLASVEDEVWKRFGGAPQ